MMSLAVVGVVSYLAFVFLSESFNPIVKPRIQVCRAQWRYGRRIGLAVLGGGLVSVMLSEVLAVPLIHAVLVGLVVALVLALCCSIGKIRGILND